MIVHLLSHLVGKEEDGVYQQPQRDGSLRISKASTLLYCPSCPPHHSPPHSKSLTSIVRWDCSLSAFPWSESPRCQVGGLSRIPTSLEPSTSRTLFAPRPPSHAPTYRGRLHLGAPIGLLASARHAKLGWVCVFPSSVVCDHPGLLVRQVRHCAGGNNSNRMVCCIVLQSRKQISGCPSADVDISASYNGQGPVKLLAGRLLTTRMLLTVTDFLLPHK